VAEHKRFTFVRRGSMSHLVSRPPESSPDAASAERDLAEVPRPAQTQEGPIDAASRDWHRRVVRHQLRKRIEVATYVGGACGVFALWAIARWHLTAPRPLWLVCAVFAAVSAAGWAVDAFHDRRPGRVESQLRIAVPAVGVTVIIYLIGWGPALAVGYVFPMLNMTFYGATRRAFQMAVWPLVALAVGQSLVAVGAVHLLLNERSSMALAVVGAVAVIFLAVLVARVAQGKEEAERELAYAASHDLLTGLMNRTAFTESLLRLVSASRRHGQPVALLFCDLVGFKQVNDRLGHAAGDYALAEVGRRIASCTRAEDLVARFGGDEFVVALTSPTDSVATSMFADRVLAVVEVPINLSGERLRLGVSIGIAFCGSGRTDMNALLSEADAAMYQAKTMGRPAQVLHFVGPAAALDRRETVSYGAALSHGQSAL
jgi:diguanylate cyclase (GGDEF)-like protein